MFETIKNRLFVAKIQAEIMAQHNDQDFVNEICQLPVNLEKIIFLREYAYFKKDRAAPFIVACEVLHASLYQNAISDSHKTICAALLAQRLEKVTSNPQFRLQHLMVFGKLEEDFVAWANLHQQINTARNS